MAIASVNGLQLYYEEHGTGHPLVLLHGGLHTIDLSFGPLIPLLAPSYRLIAVEMQGHGRTADIDREPTYDNLADDVAALLDHLGVERADVFGFSLGGLVGIELGLRHPDRVDRLAPDPDHFQALSEKLNGVVHSDPGWSDEDMRRIAAPVLLVIGDTDFVRIEHAAQMLELIPDAQLAVLPGTRHTEVPYQTDVLVPMLTRFLK